jgi:hypothetical protein
VFRFCSSHRWEERRIDSSPFPNPDSIRRFGCKPEDDLPGGPIFNRGPTVLHALLAMRHFHEPAGSNETNDPATWGAASYSAHPVDSLEPLPDAPNPYREAALYHLQIMLAFDEFVTRATDARLAVVSVAVALGWPSTRGLSIGNIAGQLGCTTTALTRSIAKFREMAGLNSAGGIRPGAGSLNGDKPAAGQA